MTAPKQKIKPLSLFLLSLFVLFLLRSHATVRALSDGLRLCARTVIPSLFPFLVLSEALVHSGALELPARLLERPMRALFGIGGGGGCALLLGILCGFPVGSRNAVLQYERGQLEERELVHLLCFCNLPSSAFLVGAVGVSLFGSHRFGMLLYLCVLLAALLCGILFRLFFFRTPHTSPARPHTPTVSPPLFSVLTASVRAAAESMLYICAFVCFFSSLGGMISLLPLSDTLKTVLCGALEMTGGMELSSHLPRPTAALLAAALGGWSGLSVHLQLMAILPHRIAPMRPYLCAKLLQAALSTSLMALALRILPQVWLFPAQSAPAVTLSPMLPSLPPLLLLFLLLLWGIRRGRSFRKYRKNS